MSNFPRIYRTFLGSIYYTIPLYHSEARGKRGKGREAAQVQRVHGHACGVRVHKVQRVQRVQRGRLTALRAEGCGIAASRQSQTTAPAARWNTRLLVLRTTSPKGKHVTGFSGRNAPLHPLLSLTPVPLPPRRGKSALCLTFISYVMNSILEIGHFRAQPGCMVFHCIASAAAAGGIQHSPLNQPALWAEPEAFRGAAPARP